MVRDGSERDKKHRERSAPAAFVCEGMRMENVLGFFLGGHGIDDLHVIVDRAKYFRCMAEESVLESRPSFVVPMSSHEYIDCLLSRNCQTLSLPSGAEAEAKSQRVLPQENASRVHQSPSTRDTCQGAQPK